MKTTKNKLAKIFYVLAFFFIILYFPTSLWHFPDGIGYYSYLPVLFVLKNYDFMPLYKLYTHNIGVSDRGFVINDFSCGCAVLWSVAYLISRIFESGQISIIFVNFFSSLFGIFSLYFVYKTLLLFKINNLLSKVITLFVFVGSPLLFYCYVVPQNPHTMTAFLCSAYLYFWLSTLKQKRLSRWFVLGTILGLATLIREQEVLFVFPLVLEIFEDVFTYKKFGKFYFKAICVFMSAFLLALSAYFLNSLIMFGKIIVPKGYTISLKQLSFSSVFDVLFSSYHGIFWWTPILFVGILGLFLGIKEKLVVFVSFILILFSEIFLISLVVSPAGGWSFGIRYLTDCLLIFAVGIAQVYSFLKSSKAKYVFFIICSILCLWTVILLILSAKNSISLIEPYTVSEFINVVINNFGNLFRIKVLPRIVLDTEKYFFMSILFIICFCFTKLIYSAISSNTSRILLSTVLISLIIFFNFKIINAGIFNRIVYRDYKGFLSFNDYKNYYLLAGLRVRVKYYKKTGNKKKYQFYFNMLKNLKFETEKGKILYKSFIEYLEKELT